MKTEDFVFAMNETADKFITEPFEEAKEGKIIRFRKWAAVAACICLVLASATVVAAEVFDIGFNLLQRERNDRNGTYTAEGYVLDFEIGTHPQESVGAMEEIRNLLNQKKYITIYASNIEKKQNETKIVRPAVVTPAAEEASEEAEEASEAKEAGESTIDEDINIIFNRSRSNNRFNFSLNIKHRFWRCFFLLL